jgi:WD40 repeat protein
MAMTPDGNMAACSCYNGTLAIWDLRTRSCIALIDAHKEGATAVSITADGRWVLSGGEDCTLRLWNVEKRCCVRTLREGHLGKVTWVAFDPVGPTALSGHFVDPDDMNTAARLLNVWDLSEGRIVHSYWQFNSVASAAMVPDGRIVVTRDHDGRMYFWYRGQNKPFRELQTDGTFGGGVAITADGTMAVSCEKYGHLRLWRVCTGELMAEYGVQPIVESLGMAIDGSVVIAGSSWGSEIAIIDLRTCGKARNRQTAEEPILEVALLGDACRILATGTNKTRSIWTPGPEGKVQREQSLEGTYESVHFEPRKRVFAAIGEDFSFKAWQADTGKTILNLKGFPHHFSCATWVAEGSIAVLARFDGTLQMWDLDAVVRRAEIRRHRRVGNSGGRVAVAALPSQRYATSWGSDRTLRVLDLAEGNCQATVPVNDGARLWDWTPDGKVLFLTTSGGGLRAMWSPPTRGSADLVPPVRDTDWCEVTSDGRHLLVLHSQEEEKVLGLWSLQKLCWVSTVKFGPGSFKKLSLAPDCGTVWVHDHLDGSIRVWGLPENELLACYYDPDQAYAMSQVTPDGRCAIGTQSGGVKLLRLVNAEMGASFVTATYRWQYARRGGEWDSAPSAQCPACRRRFSAPGAALSAIDDIHRDADLISGKVPCWRLPDRAWDLPALRSTCPYCGLAVRFNPFIWDDRSGYRWRGLQDTTNTGNSARTWRESFKGITVHCNDRGDVAAEMLVSPIEDVRAWMTWSRSGRQRCVICRNKGESYGVQTHVGPLCAVCAESTLEACADAVDLDQQPAEWFVDALSPQAGLFERLTVLWRFNEIMRSARTQWSQHMREQLLRYLVGNLGYVGKHRLAHRVRDVACQRCVETGNEVLGSLLSCNRRMPWQLVANVMQAAVQIAPEREECNAPQKLDRWLS